MTMVAHPPGPDDDQGGIEGGNEKQRRQPNDEKRAPQAPHRQKSKQLAEVPKADVVVTNPTHIAVALRYDRKTMRAPKVIAKGIRLNAQNPSMIFTAKTRSTLGIRELGDRELGDWS